jgi:hypothetical protein
VGVVELDAVEARLSRTSGCGGKQTRQLRWEVTYLRQMDVSYTLTIAVVERFQLARI